MASTLPSNVHVSKHPCLRAKLSLLRSQATGTRQTKALVNDIATILGIEALAGLEVHESGTVSLPAFKGESWERGKDGLNCSRTPLPLVMSLRLRQYQHQL